MTKGNQQLIQHNSKGIQHLTDAFVVLVRTDWNAHIIDALEKGCKKVLKQYAVKHKVITVPGAVEIPFAIAAYARKAKKKADAFIALGTVIRGDTPHFDYVCKAVTDGIMHLNVTLDVPSIFGVLTVDNEQQALERIGGKHGHKGEEAGLTALRMIELNRTLM